MNIHKFSTVGECVGCGEVASVCGNCHSCDECHVDGIVEKFTRMTPEQSNAAHAKVRQMENPRLQVLGNLLLGIIGLDEAELRLKRIGGGHE